MNEHAKLPPQPTSSMKHFAILIGEWKMVETYPEFPSAAHGHSSFSWLMDGGLLVWHFDWERGGPPGSTSATHVTSFDFRSQKSRVIATGRHHFRR